MTLFKKSFVLFSILSLLLFVSGIMAVPSKKAEATIAVSVTANGVPNYLSVNSGTSVRIDWNAPTATSCYNNFNTSTANNGFYIYTATVARTFTVECSAPDLHPTCSSYYYPTCFTADTKVTMADESSKKIQDVKVGDVLKGEKTNNKVLGLHRPELNGKLYSFNSGPYFVTEEHPFKTTDGWKSINPKKTENENIGIVVTTLSIGDTLITEKGLVKLKTIDSKEAKANTDLFNFILDGDHTYYADGYLVHNKDACLGPTGQMLCGSGFCIDSTNGQVAPSGICPMRCTSASYMVGSDPCTAGKVSVCTPSGNVVCVLSSSCIPNTYGT